MDYLQSLLCLYILGADGFILSLSREAFSIMIMIDLGHHANACVQIGY